MAVGIADRVQAPGPGPQRVVDPFVGEEVLAGEQEPEAVLEPVGIPRRVRQVLPGGGRSLPELSPGEPVVVADGECAPGATAS